MVDESGRASSHLSPSISPGAHAAHSTERVKVYKCPSCAGVLSYEPAKEQFACASCGSSYPLDRVIPKTVRQLHGFTCPECGAELISDDKVASFSCPYCGNNEVMASKFDGVFEPDFIIPFAVDREDAIRRFGNFAKSMEYVPKDFPVRFRIVSIEGTYVPFWLFSGRTDFDITYDYTLAGKHHRAGSVEYMRIPADASVRMPNDMMDSLHPYDYSIFEPFTTDFMPGFVAERYTEHYDESRKRVTEQAKEGTIEFLRPPKTSEKTRHSLEIFESDAGPEQALLPVWMLIIEYKGKRFLAGVNGQTGKAAMNFPIDIGKGFAHATKQGAIFAALGILGVLLLLGAIPLYAISEFRRYGYMPFYHTSSLIFFFVVLVFAIICMFVIGFIKKRKKVVRSTHTVREFEAVEKHLNLRTLKLTTNDYIGEPPEHNVPPYTEVHTGSFGVSFELPEYRYNAQLSHADPQKITWKELRDFVAAHCDRNVEPIIVVKDRMRSVLDFLTVNVNRQGYLTSKEPGPIRIGFIRAPYIANAIRTAPKHSANVESPMTGGELIDFLTRCVEELGPDKEAKWIWETPPGLNKYYYTGRYFYSSDPRFDMLAFAKQGIFLIQGDILEQEIAS